MKHFMVQFVKMKIFYLSKFYILFKILLYLIISRTESKFEIFISPNIILLSSGHCEVVLYTIFLFFFNFNFFYNFHIK